MKPTRGSVGVLLIVTVLDCPPPGDVVVALEGQAAFDSSLKSDDMYVT
jgi:hypothetical protein